MNSNLPMLEFSFSISPVSDFKHNIIGLISDFNSNMIQKYYPERIGQKVNTVLSELLFNIAENYDDDKSKADIALKIENDKIIIKTKNKVNEGQYEYVKKHIKIINSEKDVSKLLSETIKERRSKNETGGLGLIRLSSELNAKLQTTFNKKNSLMTITAKITI